MKQRRFIIWAFISLLIALSGSIRWLLPTPNLPSTSLSETPTSPAISPTYSAEIYEQSFKVRPGETLGSILISHGFDATESHAAIEALRNRFNPKDLKPGQDIFIRGKITQDNTAKLLRLMIRPNLENEIVVSRTEEGSFQVGVVKKKLVYQVMNSRGNIRSSLYADALKAGVPAQVISELTQGFSYAIHLQRDVHEDAPFEVVFETIKDEETGNEKPGALIYAAIGIRGVPMELYRYQNSEGIIDLFNESGESVRRALLVTPVSAARLSSPYGMRRHPILGYSRMHKGVDFAAPRGTPVMAAGDGVISFAGRKGGYGNYAMINHRNGFSTAYGHLSKFATHLRKGKPVRQGEIIGYVGSTGMASGPHLHYETLLNGHHMDPQKIKQPPRIKLVGNEAKLFNKFKQQIRRHVRGLTFKNQFVMGQNHVKVIPAAAQHN